MDVSDLERNSLEGIWIGPIRGSEAKTDTRGLVKLRLAQGTEEGHRVELILGSGSSETWVFVSPWDRYVRVPPFDKESEFERVVVGKKGSRELLRSDVAMSSALNDIRDSLGAFERRQREVTEVERQQVLAEKAREYGLTVDRLDEALRAFGERAEDPFDKALGAYYEQNFVEAETQLEVSREVRWERPTRAEAELGKADDELVEVDVFLGQVRYEQGHYAEAVEPFQEALSVFLFNLLT